MPSEEEGERETRLEILRRDVMPSDVSANWIRIRRRMKTKAIGVGGAKKRESGGTVFVKAEELRSARGPRGRSDLMQQGGQPLRGSGEKVGLNPVKHPI